MIRVLDHAREQITISEAWAVRAGFDYGFHGSLRLLAYGIASRGHLESVEEIAEDFAAKFGDRTAAQLAELWLDLGKYQ